MGRHIRLRACYLAVFLLACSSCAEAPRTIDVALEDGARVTGILVAVEPDWLVLDQNVRSSVPDILLLDKAIVDTVRIPGALGSKERGAITIVGALAGGLAGYWAGEGYLPDSTHPADPKRGTRATLGGIAGFTLGGLLGVLISDALKPADLIFTMPEEEQYDSISEYAKYPNGLPPDLRMAIDSEWEIRSRN